MLMMSIGDQPRDARGAASPGDVSEQRAIADRHHGLGQLQREGSEPRAEAGRQNQRAGHAPSMPESSPPSRGACYPKGQMRYLRSFTATLLSAAITFSLVTASGCGTNAVGVDDCRSIEQARCHAGAPCGIIEDVDACDRYYRDHCLHGLATKPPAGASVSACVQVIEAAGRCAQADPNLKLSG